MHNATGILKYDMHDYINSINDHYLLAIFQFLYLLFLLLLISFVIDASQKPLLATPMRMRIRIPKTDEVSHHGGKIKSRFEGCYSSEGFQSTVACKGEGSHQL